MHKKLIPPVELADWVGAGDFELRGKEFFDVLLKEGLTPRTRVLDVGCGCGRVAAHFVDNLDSDVEYAGFDVHIPSIMWCREHYPANFHFQHVDIYNSFYNKNGLIHGKDFVFPYSDNCFDLVYLCSVFTHMLSEELTNYVNEIRRVLTPTGKCISTMFLINEKKYEEREKQGLTFPFSYNSTCWVNDEKLPTAAVGYDEDFVRAFLKPEKVDYWFQDVVVWKKQVN